MQCGFHTVKVDGIIIFENCYQAMAESSTLKIIRIFLIIVLSSVVFNELWQTCQDFSEGKSAIATKNVLKEKPEPLPTFSLCAEPAFNEEYLKEQLNFTENLWLPSTSLKDFPSNVEFR